MKKSQKLFLYSFLLSLVAGCAMVQTEYQNQENLNGLQKEIDQAPAKEKGIADKFITKKIKFIDEIANNKNITGISSVSFKDEKNRKGQTTEIWAKVKKDGICTVYFSGPMSKRSEDEFYKVVKYTLQNQCSDVLLKLSSPGGIGLVGIAVGLTARKLGWNTVAWRGLYRKNPQDCVSACSIAFLGGNKRFLKGNLFGDISHILFHQASRQVADEQEQICVSDPKDITYLVFYKYLQIVAPENPLLLLGKVLSIPCSYTISGSSYSGRVEPQWITPKETLWNYFKDEYTSDIEYKYQ
jgi:hypothetical protein